MIPLLKGYERIRTAKLVKGFTHGLTTASVGLIAAATVQIGKSSLTNLVAWLIFPFAFGLVYFLKWNPIVCLLVASGAGLILKIWL